MTEEIKIDKDFSFDSSAHMSINSVKEALNKYSENFENAKNLNSNIPIFLDTNVLLNYYGMSSSEKTKLIEFLNEKSDVIIITKQIEKEFIRNRVSVINDYFSSLKKIKTVVEKDLINDIKNKFNSVLGNKILKEDYSDYWNLINNQLEKLNKELFEEDTAKSKLFDSIDEQIKVNKHIKIEDNVLDTYQNFTVTESLDENELTFLKSEYKRLLALYKDTKETVRWKLAFPGCGESKELDKADGDFIIYHEILKYMKKNKTDAILLTNDVTKDDWISKKNEPFIHYIEKTYLNSNQNLYIFEAQRLLADISFENIYDEEYYDEELYDEENRSVQVAGNLILECDICGTIHSRNPIEMDLYFELESSSERRMGEERLYQALDSFECDCGTDITTTFQVWEYPKGTYNSDHIDSDMATIKKEPIIEL